MEIRKAMVLAAGKGTRLLPATETMPKALVPVAGRPMIHYPLCRLCEQGITEVVVNVHYLADMLCNALEGGADLGINVSFSREPELLGTGGGIGRAARYFQGERIVLINADTLIDADLCEVLRGHLSNQASATLVAVERFEPENYTPVWVDSEDAVRKVGGNGTAGLKPVVYTGLSILEPEIVERLPGNRYACLVKDGLVPAIDDGLLVRVHLHHGYWKGLDTAARIREAQEDISEGRIYLPGGFSGG